MSFDFIWVFRITFTLWNFLELQITLYIFQYFTQPRRIVSSLKKPCRLHPKPLYFMCHVLWTFQMLFFPFRYIFTEIRLQIEKFACGYIIKATQNSCGFFKVLFLWDGNLTTKNRHQPILLYGFVVSGWATRKSKGQMCRMFKSEMPKMPINRNRRNICGKCVEKHKWCWKTQTSKTDTHWSQLFVGNKFVCFFLIFC